MAHVELPRAYLGIARAQPKRGFNSGEAVLAVAEKHVPEAEVRMRGRIVGVVRKRGLGLRYAAFHCRLAKKTIAFALWANASFG